MYCEDYPCCGHTPQDPCDPRMGASVDHYYAKFSDPDYDDYYDYP